MTDSPCSAPAVIRHLLDMEHDDVRAACQRHDLAYSRGGTERDRFLADLVFAVGLLDTPMTEHAVEQVYDAVRAWAARHFTYVEGAAPIEPAPQEAP